MIHSGLYYAPGSAKATLCRRGKRLLEAFCTEHGVPFETCGKVVVATHNDELPRLERLAERAQANGVRSRRIGAEEIRQLEPHARGIAGLHVAESGIVDYRAMCDRLVELIRASGRGDVRFDTEVRGVSNASIQLRSGEELPSGDALVNCTGLHSDRIARRSGTALDARIVPFRGEYFVLRPEAEHLVRNLIYPVPDPRFPFLGVHFTRMIGGGVECGPNAVFALAREGYRWRDVSPRDMCDALLWPGTLRLFGSHWRTGLGETWRSFSKRAFVRALQRLVPDIRTHHLERAPSGVRAQALSRDGNLVDDFAIERHGAALHVLNAPSPAATASLAIGEVLAERALEILRP